MAIQHRRGDESDLDISKLKAGEMAVCTDTGKTVIKLTGENYIVLADSKSIEAVQNALKDKAPLEHKHSMADIEDMASGGTILYENSSGDNTSEMISLSDSAENYSAIEVVYGTSAIRQTVRCMAGDTAPTMMSLVGGDDVSISIFSGAFLVKGNTQLRGSALSNELGKSTVSERSFSILHDVEGELNFVGSVKNAEDGYYISIFRVIAYK